MKIVSDTGMDIHPDQLAGGSVVTIPLRLTLAGVTVPYGNTPPALLQPVVDLPQ